MGGPGLTCVRPAVVGNECTQTYAPGAIVTLTARAAAGSGFTGWGGACAGAGTADCVVTMSAARAVTATFAKFPFTPGRLRAQPSLHTVRVAASGGGRAPSFGRSVTQQKLEPQHDVHPPDLLEFVRPDVAAVRLAAHCGTSRSHWRKRQRWPSGSSAS